MGLSQSVSSNFCPHCEALLSPGWTECWLCGASAPTAVTAPFPNVPQGECRPASRGRLQYGLSSLLLFMTLVAILCSITSMSPGLGIGLIILSVPALVRTCVVAPRSGVHGQPMSVRAKTAVFLITIPVVVFVCVTAAAAFFATCGVTMGIGGTVSGRWDSSLVVAVILGSIVGLMVAVLLTRLLLKSSRRRHTD